MGFQVVPGEVVGIIGRNGAGKSTLLKILSRITEPTVGRAELRGRVGSLLEVGTGFHPELTGRENIFLNGAILGMRRSEISARLDEIIAFAEVEQFLDTPVKRYSSGMYLRLAFSVAAHLEPEILLVDEVLAVGDAAFQKRCIGKMSSVASTGRTVIFVSHNLAAVRGLCSRCLLLESGVLKCDGTPDAVIDAYLSALQAAGTGEADIADKPRAARVDETLRIERVRLLADAPPFVPSTAPLAIEMRFRVVHPISGLVLGFSVETLDGTVVFEVRSVGSLGPLELIPPGVYETRCEVRDHHLLPRHYALSVGARSDRKYLDYVRQVLIFEVQPGEGHQSPWYDQTSGLVKTASQWEKPVPVPDGRL